MNLLWGSFVATFAWSISGIFTKVILRDISPMVLTLMVVVLWTSMLLLTCFWKPELFTLPTSLSTSTWVYVFVLTLIGFYIPYWAHFAIMQQHDAYKVFALSNFSNIFDLFLVWYILKETITRKSFTGIALIIIGAWMV